MCQDHSSLQRELSTPSSTKALLATTRGPEFEGNRDSETTRREEKTLLYASNQHIKMLMSQVFSFSFSPGICLVSVDFVSLLITDVSTFFGVRKAHFLSYAIAFTVVASDRCVFFGRAVAVVGRRKLG